MVMLVVVGWLALVGAVAYVAYRRGVGSGGTLTPQERERGLTAEEKARAIHQQTHWRRL
ncbi:hypothetical protein ITI46_01205 [Streptomyces oryzae]|uniref:SHOCT domain-containing protein n=1 Tax=Streptomyces oryzae TaxID=1434886 RepID=A0ABS3X4N3_9ACTN|nr:hypothetical protein [Streptomyces oryzae]MBO8190339.1 hypothetical protein [Streptomyces oryzae]